MRTDLLNTFGDDDWWFIVDSLNDRLENLTDLDGWAADIDFSKDIAQCQFLIDTIKDGM